MTGHSSQASLGGGQSRARPPLTLVKWPQLLVSAAERDACGLWRGEGVRLSVFGQDYGVVVAGSVLVAGWASLMSMSCDRLCFTGGHQRRAEVPGATLLFSRWDTDQ